MDVRKGADDKFRHCPQTLLGCGRPSSGSDCLSDRCAGHRRGGAGGSGEKNPPGDIPDNQVFVSYRSPFGFTLQVPEGWSRADRPDGVRFFDKYNMIDIDVAQSAAAPHADSVRSREAAALVPGEHAANIASVTDVKLRGGPAVRIVYTASSEPNPVTNKQIRLEHERFIFFKDGKTATADFAAPQGADNADQWRFMANSFQWR
jgi:hypothetical protein